MTVDEFRDLALRVLEGTADTPDRVRLAEARAASAERAAEWEQLQRAWKQARALGPALRAVTGGQAAGAAVTPPPAPVEELIRRTVRVPASTTRRSAWWIAAGIAAAVAAGFFLAPRLRPSRAQEFATAPTWIDQPWPRLVASLATEPTRRTDSEIVVLAPALATTSRTPTVAWTSAPGKTYTVTVAAAAEPDRALHRAERATSPLAWKDLGGAAELSVGDAFVVTVSEAGRPLTATTRRFVTVAEPAAAPSAEATFIAALFESEPARLGDAWLLWQELPETSRDSPRGRRLYLVLVARLGWEAEFQRRAAVVPAGP